MLLVHLSSSSPAAPSVASEAAERRRLEQACTFSMLDQTTVRNMAQGWKLRRIVCQFTPRRTAKLVLEDAIGIGGHRLLC